MILDDLALVLGVAAVTTVIFRRLRQPVVLGYLLAGLIVGPHIPIPLFADASRIHTLSELGVVLVMFSVGLEFSVRKLARVLPTSGLVGLVQIGTMLALGYLTGQAFGFSPHERIFLGAIVSISSTMIVAKVFAEERVGKALTETVFGVLVVQDLAAVLLLALLTALVSGRGQALDVLARTSGELALFLGALVLTGFFVVPRTIRAIAALKSPETLLVASIGTCFALALLAQRVGYSVALGAFVAGSLVAESGEAEQVEQLVRPVRDVFAAIFFVSVGMVLDPRLVLAHWKLTVVLVLVVIVGQIVSVTLGAFLSGRDVKTSIQAGMSLAQIGEFSFVLAALGADSGAVRPFLFPVAVAVSLLTAFSTPLLVRASGRVAIAFDRGLPKPLQTFVTVYGAWLERLRASGAEPAERSRRATLVRWLALDAVVLVVIVIVTSLAMDPLLGLVREHLGFGRRVGRPIVVGVGILLAMPFVVGVLRVARVLGTKLVEEALPDEGGEGPRSSAPRRALLLTVQLVVVSLVSLPLLALTQPFLPPLYGIATFAVVLALVAIAVGRTTTELEEHVQAGTERIVEALGRQVAQANEPALDELVSLVPGLGSLTPIVIAAGNAAEGKTLAGINLRALSGATVITILRSGEAIEPTGREPLRAGDVLAVAGSREAVREARALIAGELEAPSAEPPESER